MPKTCYRCIIFTYNALGNFERRCLTDVLSIYIDRIATYKNNVHIIPLATDTYGYIAIYV